MRRGAAAALAVLVLAGCGGSTRDVAAPARSGPAGVVRIALADLRWPIDPARATGRDETTLVRTLLATPIRVDPHTAALLPGLCRTWRASSGSRVWTLSCRHAGAIARELRRFALVAGSARRIEARPGRLRVELRFPWRRFPYALSAAAAAPPGVPGAFRVVAASPGRLVAERPGQRLVFRRLAPLDAVAAFRRGELDEAPVPPGDLRAAELDRSLAAEVQVRRLLGLDLVVFRLDGGPLASLLNTRRAYWTTAARADYQGLVPEGEAAAAYGVVPGAPPTTAAEVRRARAFVHFLPALRVPIRAPPALAGDARILWGTWRDDGLGPDVVGGGPAAAEFLRLLAPWPKLEAIPASLLLARDRTNPWGAGRTPPRAALLRALAAPDPSRELVRVDAELREQAAVIPVAWAVDARLVSSRLEGWSEDALGVPDYARVRSLGSSPSR